MTAIADQVRGVLAWLKRHGDKRTRDEMMPRYGIIWQVNVVLDTRAAMSRRVRS